MKHGRTIRRIVAKASIFLLLGAIVNVVAAVGFSAGTNIHIAGARFASASSGEIRRRGVGVRVKKTLVVAYEGFGSSAQLEFPILMDVSIDPWLLAQGLHKMLDLSVPDRNWQLGVDVTCRRQSGWPVRGLDAERTSPAAPASSTDGHCGTAAMARLRTVSMPQTPLWPWVPLWPGFAVNTLFYAAILWLLFAAPFALRHRRRLKRGLCPACAYPVGTSDLCTECGKPVTAGPRPDPGSG